MYLQYFALGFFLFAIADIKNWYTWSLLAVLCLLLKLNIAIFDVSMDARYTVRCTLIVIFAMLLMKEYTKTSGYQAFILFLFLAVNPLMLHHKSFDNFFYANYEAIIYGLVSCQFIAIIPRIWRCFSDRHSGDLSSDKNKRLVDRV